MVQLPPPVQVTPLLQDTSLGQTTVQTEPAGQFTSHGEFDGQVAVHVGPVQGTTQPPPSAQTPPAATQSEPHATEASVPASRGAFVQTPPLQTCPGSQSELVVQGPQAPMTHA